MERQCRIESYIIWILYTCVLTTRKATKPVYSFDNNYLGVTTMGQVILLMDVVMRCNMVIRTVHIRDGSRVKKRGVLLRDKQTRRPRKCSRWETVADWHVVYICNGCIYIGAHDFINCVKRITHNDRNILSPKRNTDFVFTYLYNVYKMATSNCKTFILLYELYLQWNVNVCAV